MTDASQNADRALLCIIYDDHGVGDSFRVLLTVHGFHVVAYSSAVAFLADQRPAPPRCLIVDQNMPDMDGLALIGELHRRGPTVPTVLLTERSDPSLVARAEGLGVCAIVEKPFAAAPLLALIRTILAAE